MAADRIGPYPPIGGGASTTPGGEPWGMGRSGPGAYGGIHGHPRPAATRIHPMAPHRPVVTGGLAPGTLPGRGDPGAARRAARAGSAGRGPAVEFEWVPAVLARRSPEGDAAHAHRPGGRVPRGARPDRDAPAAAAEHGRGGDAAAAGDRGPLDPAGIRRLREVPGDLAPARLPLPGRPGDCPGRDRRGGGVAGGLPVRLRVHLRDEAAAAGPAVPRPVVV